MSRRSGSATGDGFGKTLTAPVSEVPDLVPLRARLRLIARFGPAAGALLEIARLLRQPFILVAVAAHDHQRVLQIDRVVGAETELARSEEHTSELQSLMRTSYAVFCLKK